MQDFLKLQNGKEWGCYSQVVQVIPYNMWEAILISDLWSLVSDLLYIVKSIKQIFIIYHQIYNFNSHSRQTSSNWSVVTDTILRSITSHFINKYNQRKPQHEILFRLYPLYLADIPSMKLIKRRSIHWKNVLLWQKLSSSDIHSIPFLQV